MKRLLTILILLPVLSFAQDERIQAFDASLHVSMGIRPVQDQSVNISGGISGRRIPVSLLVGYGCLEFADDFPKMNYSRESQWLANATLMVRTMHIDFRSMDFNIYSTAYKLHKDYFYEYGGMIGMLVNDRSRIYLSAGELTGKDHYKAPMVGVHFALYFFNGYSAY
jgi:hypothetical protein